MYSDFRRWRPGLDAASGYDRLRKGDADRPVLESIVTRGGVGSSYFCSCTLDVSRFWRIKPKWSVLNLRNHRDNARSLLRGLDRALFGNLLSGLRNDPKLYR